MVGRLYCRVLARAENIQNADGLPDQTGADRAALDEP
jgi:hypothetical protein